MLKKIINKCKLKTFALTLSLLPAIFSPTESLARPDVNFFIDEYQNIFKIMLNSYKEQVKEPLDGRLFDVRDPMVSTFVKNVTKEKDNHHFLSMWFYRDFKVNNKKTNFCFLIYDSNRLMELDRYLNSTFPSDIDAVYYLAAHEFGHCAVAHQRTIGNITPFNDLKKEELYAEIFSIVFFLSREQNEQAISVIRQNMFLDKDSTHYNPEKLKKAYILFNDEKPTVNNMYDLYKISYDYFTKIEDNPDLLKDELESKSKLLDNELKEVSKLILKNSTVLAAPQMY